MPSSASFSVNSNGLIPKASMPPLVSPSPLKPDANGNSNTAAGDLIARVVGQSTQGVGENVDLTA
jgi:hypothetical protein